MPVAAARPTNLPQNRRSPATQAQQKNPKSQPGRRPTTRASNRMFRQRARPHQSQNSPPTKAPTESTGDTADIDRAATEQSDDTPAIQEEGPGPGVYDSEIEDLIDKSADKQQEQEQEKNRLESSGDAAEDPLEAPEHDGVAPVTSTDSVPEKTTATDGSDEPEVAPETKADQPADTQESTTSIEAAEGTYDSDLEDLQHEHQDRKRKEAIPHPEPDPAAEREPQPATDATTETVTMPPEAPAEAPSVREPTQVAPAPVIELPSKAPDKPSTPARVEPPDQSDTPPPPTEQAAPSAQPTEPAPPMPPAPADEEEEGKTSTHWDWNWIDKQDDWGFDGLKFVGKYGLLAARLGGRVIVDGGILAQQQSLDQAYPDFNGSNAMVRSAQAQLAGYFGPYIIFKAQAEFAPDFRGFKDAFIVFQDIPYVANLRLGIGKEPFSLENLTSFKFIPFMERSLMSALTPGRSFGALIYNNFFRQRMTLAAGMFYRSATWADIEFDSSQGVDLTGRLTALPSFGLKNSLVHIGMSLLKRSNVGDVSFSTTPETRLTDTRYVDTGELDADATSTLGLEFAWQRGPMTVQAEVSQTQIENNQGPEADFHGGYVMLDYNLTGEIRRYARAAGTFGSIRPEQPFSWREGRGMGALNTALRLSWVDLDDSGIDGGRERNISAVLNWYPTDKFRFALNFTHGHVRSLADGRKQHPARTFPVRILNGQRTQNSPFF